MVRAIMGWISIRRWLDFQVLVFLDHSLGSIQPLSGDDRFDLFSKGKFKDWLDHGLTGLYVIYNII